MYAWCVGVEVLESTSSNGGGRHSLGLCNKHQRHRSLSFFVISKQYVSSFLSGVYFSSFSFAFLCRTAKSLAVDGSGAPPFPLLTLIPFLLRKLCAASHRLNK